jgi:hypothetical protein
MLQTIATAAPCLAYQPYVPGGGGIGGIIYHPELIVPPRIYGESLAYCRHFYYERGGDRLVGWAMFDTVQWPGWACWRYEWDAGSGALLSRTAASLFTLTYTGKAGLGSYGSIYITRNTDLKIWEVPWDTLWPTAGLWSIAPQTWTPARIFTHAVVNRENSLIAGVAGAVLEVWDIAGTPALRGSLRLPQSLGYMAYEDRDNLWIITSGGLVAKANYRLYPPRWEMLSSVQDPTADALAYLCAFDTKRKRLAVFRQRPDALDGACQCQIEFYQPLWAVTGLTDPVPVSIPRVGERVQFVAHLHGERGEGVTPYSVEGALTVPALGRLLDLRSGTALNGAAGHRYEALALGEETLTLTATVTD